jgi:glycosyltransferase involved in cell wall biosynthesis
MRMRRVAGLLPDTPAEIVVSSSSLLHDVWPAWRHRRRHGSRMAVFVFHLIPKRSGGGRRLQFLLAALGQSLCLRLYRDADVLFAGNALVRDSLIAEGIPPDRVHIYYPAMDRAAIEGAAPIERYDALFVGRMVERKGIFDVLDAVDGLGIRVGMVGEGEDREKLEEEVRRRGMQNQVDVLGALPDAQVHGLLRGCRFFLFPSREEGYGMVIAEAMIAGKPIITYALPHYAESFGDGLIAVPLGDRAALREAVADLVAGRIDAAEHVSRYRNARLFTPAEAAAFCLARLRPVA